MEVRLIRSPKNLPKDAPLALFVVQGDRALTRAKRDIARRFGTGSTGPIDSGDFRGKEAETAVLYPSRGPVRRLITAGLGTAKTVNAEMVRRAASAAARKAQAIGATSLAFDLSTLPRLRQQVASALIEGAILGSYVYDKHRTQKDPEPQGKLSSVHILSGISGGLREVGRAIEHGRILAEATVLARDLVNAPGNELYPQSLAGAAMEAGERAGFKVTVMDEAEIADLGMGGIMGVAQGSTRPPRLIVLEYGQAGKKPVVLIGKGVTFDAGGISIKPAANMAEMKMDMSGAAAVIGTFQAIAFLRLPVHVVGLIPAVENMPSGNSLRPGDILHHHNGMTSEVDNTDAEGRLILADALSYAQRFKPAALIDVATLTGACVVALGHHATGMMGTDQRAMRLLQQAGEATYERVWELPLFKEYEKQIKSDVADVKNVGGRWAGAITGALFLKAFVGKHRWVHLDIAGTAILEEAGPYSIRGGSGVGVRLLTEFLRRWR